MKKILVALAIVALGLSPAVAQKAPAPTPKPGLTILEVLNIGQALRQMGDFHDNRGNLVAVPFKFDASTLMTFAVNIRAADDAQKAYQDAYAKFETQELGNVAGVKADDLQRRKQEIANSDSAKRMLENPTGAIMGRIKESDLCMKTPPVPPCTATNAIPPALLAAILPIIDR